MLAIRQALCSHREQRVVVTKWDSSRRHPIERATFCQRCGKRLWTFS